MENPLLKTENRKDGSRRVSQSFKNEKSRTKQCFQSECDINTILKKYRKTGLLEHVNRFGGDYSDVSGVGDYQQSLNQVMLAQDMFESLPADIRTKFGNDPGRFLDFVEDPQNEEELIELGLKPRQHVKTLEDYEEKKSKAKPGAGKVTPPKKGEGKIEKKD